MTQVVVVTGARSGLGLSLAKRFVAEGFETIGIAKHKNWKEALKHFNGQTNFTPYSADLSKATHARKLISFVKKRFGRLDILINNAGYGGTLSSVESLSLSEFKKHIEQNLFTTFVMCKYAIPILKKQKKGLIVNISSMAGKRAVPHLAAYSAAKFGIFALSQCIAKENSNAGIKCFTVCPGGMNTTMRANLFGKEDAKNQQSPDFVADVVYDAVRGKISVEPGGDIVIRHGKIVAVNPSPEA